MIPDVPYRFRSDRCPRTRAGGSLIEFPDLPGCMSDGQTIEEAITNRLDAMRGWIKAMRADRHQIPPPALRRREPLRSKTGQLGTLACQDARGWTDLDHEHQILNC